MLIMTFAHVLKTGDATLADKYVGILVFLFAIGAYVPVYSMTC